ncbi:MAG TPA: hypothetical protein VEK79_07345 [Thermoanaerobaculia bacterium]|nr:hypothetical protein [Thermoanaerobaculia bacterium]
MPDPRVTIAQFHETSHADKAKKAMDTAGIDAAVEDVRLEVHNEDAYRAFNALDPALPVVEEAYEPRAAVTQCKTCGGSVVPTNRLRAFIAIGALAVGFALAFGTTQAVFFFLGALGLFLLMSDRWRCTECGASWN